MTEVRPCSNYRTTISRLPKALTSCHHLWKADGGHCLLSDRRAEIQGKKLARTHVSILRPEISARPPTPRGWQTLAGFLTGLRLLWNLITWRTSAFQPSLVSAGCELSSYQTVRGQPDASHCWCGLSSSRGWLTQPSPCTPRWLFGVQSPIPHKVATWGSIWSPHLHISAWPCKKGPRKEYTWGKQQRKRLEGGGWGPHDSLWPRNKNSSLLETGAKGRGLETHEVWKGKEIHNHGDLHLESSGTPATDSSWDQADRLRFPGFSSLSCSIRRNSLLRLPEFLFPALMEPVCSQEWL